MSSTPLGELPKEIIVQILQFSSDIKTLGRLARTCKSFRELLQKEEQSHTVWRVAYVKSFGAVEEHISDHSWRSLCRVKHLEAQQNKNGFGNNLPITKKPQTSLLKKIENAIPWGISCSGKRYIAYYYFKALPVITNPLLGWSIEHFETNSIKFTLYNIGGQQGQLFKVMYKGLIQNNDAVVLVVDSTAIEAQQEMLRDQFLNGVVEYESERFVFADFTRDMRTHGVKILLVFANKQDLPEAFTPVEIAKRLDLNKLTDMGITWFVQPSSIPDEHTNSGMNEGFAWLSKALDQL